MATIPAYGYGSGANNPSVAPRNSTTLLAAASNSVAAPLNAVAATKTTTSDIGTGLAAALTAYSQNSARQTGFLPDEYVIKFADPIIANASMIPPGPKDKAFTGAAGANTAAAKIDPNKQSAPLTVRTKGATAGQQIIQFIDQVVRSSTYLTGQQLVIWNDKKGLWEPAPTRSAKVFAWFNILCTAEPLKYDTKRNDFSYRMTYTIVPFQTPVTSEYFTPGKFRGAHKIYNYWFTGQNNSIENFTQTFNNQWTQAITGVTTQQQPNYNSNLYVAKKQYMEASNQNRAGGANKTFEPSANAADILYTTDSIKIKLDILGDPAWLPSAESIKDVLLGLQSVYANPFNPDGSINAVASVPYFTFAWNRPVDYNLDTGLMDVGLNNFRTNFVDQQPGLAQESVTYICFKTRSKFSRGKFTQELEGVGLNLAPGEVAATNTIITTGGLTAEDRAQFVADAKADAGRDTDTTAATALVNTVAVRSNSTNSRLFDAGLVPSVVNSSNPVQAGVNSLKNYATTTLTNIGSNLLRPYEKQLSDTVNGYAKAAGNWLQDSVTSITTPKPRPAIPPEFVITDEFDGIEAPPTLAVKPGENGLGGYSYETYNEEQQGFVVADAGELPQQGIVDDDQGWA